ncbi:MAG: mechanosensitive ion channel family protein [Flavobacteriia bacterium]|jgi:small-conductance mechanosensitive channel
MFAQTLFYIGPYKICFWNLIFLLLIFLAAAVLRRLVHKVLKGYVKSANLQLEAKQMARLRLVSQSVYLLAIYIAVLSLRYNNGHVTFNDFLQFKLLSFDTFKIDFSDLLIVISVFFGAKIAVNLTRLYFARRFKGSQHYDAGTEFVYNQLAKYFIYVASILFCFKLLGIDLMILLTSSVGLLVGLGLGLQDVFKDMIAGIVLLFEGNLRVGDIVEIAGKSKINGVSNEAMVAKIVKINVRTTQIQTREGNVLIIPNTHLTQDRIENWSHGSELTRFTIKLTVAYGAELPLIERLLKQAALAHPKVKKNNPVIVRLSDFGDSGLELELIFWADQSWDINNYKSEIRFEIDRLFRNYGIEIPYPQRVMHQAPSRNS